MALTDKLTAIANAIRLKTGKSASMTLAEMPSEIESIQTGSSDVPFKYGGYNAILIDTYDEEWSLADTSFVVGSSVSTSATSIKASISNRYTDTTGSPTYNYGDKDIIVVQKCCVTPTYGDSATNKARMLVYTCEYITRFSKRKTSDTSAKTLRQAINETSVMQKYYSTGSVIARGNVSYGMYMTPQTPSVASTSSASTYVRCSSPILYYRVSSSYLSSTNMKQITDASFKWHIEVYVVDAFSTTSAQINDDIDDLIINGL